MNLHRRRVETFNDGGALTEGLVHVAVFPRPARRHIGPALPDLGSVIFPGFVFLDGKLLARFGFNHRYHPALQQARALHDSGVLGPMMYIRARYGHGGRIGYDKEWRANPAISGGGELLDQGVHLIDLARWFLGDFPHVQGHVATFFWDMPVEDNGFLLLRTAAGQVAWLHATWTEWKNTFSFEIFGRDAKLHIEGLGGSYGVERLSYYKMKPTMGPPETTIWEYPGEDRSWHLELEAFAQAIEARRPAPVGPRDAQAALEIVRQVYALSGKRPDGS